VVSVAQDHAVEIALPPIVEHDVIVVGGAPLAPVVEGLIYHQHAEPVAGVQECRGGRIVGTSDGVEAARLEHLDLAFLCPVDGHGSQRAAVVMHAAAAHGERFAVEQESLRRAELDAANTEGRGVRVQHRVARAHLHLQSIQRGVIGRPQSRVGEWQLLGKGVGGAGRDFGLRLPGAAVFAVGPQHDPVYSDLPGLVGLVNHSRLEANARGGGGHLRRGHIDPSPSTKKPPSGQLGLSGSRGSSMLQSCGRSSRRHD